MSEGKSLLSKVIAGLNIFYLKVSETLIYPIFTALFAFASVLTLTFLVLSIKSYLKYQFSLALKLAIASIISLLVAIDIYLIAFGKSALFILYLKFQKDLFFIVTSCFIGVVCGKILFKNRGNGGVIP